MVPLVVIKELEGLARGGRDRDFIPLAHVAPEHAARVAESAKTALTFLRSRLPGVRCVTSRGTVLAPTSCAMEEETDLQQGNDDRILTTSLSLCKIANDEDTKPGRC
uniref:PIN domain-containing protein n=1 Tax=Timema shepardi TaxID=629360 RepID=A0A7R9BBB9_TIMSH|nr:unnamed protein product [Timema shepardi]